MSLKDAFLFNLTADTSLRDARHANQIYTQNNFAFSMYFGAQGNNHHHIYLVVVRLAYGHQDVYAVVTA